MADALYIGLIEHDHTVLRVTANTETGVVNIETDDLDVGVLSVSSTDAHYLATLLRTAVDMIDFRAQLDAHR